MPCARRPHRQSRDGLHRPVSPGRKPGSRVRRRAGPGRRTCPFGLRLSSCTGPSRKLQAGQGDIGLWTPLHAHPLSVPLEILQENRRLPARVLRGAGAWLPPTPQSASSAAQSRCPACGRRPGGQWCWAAIWKRNDSRPCEFPGLGERAGHLPSGPRRHEIFELLLKSGVVKGLLGQGKHCDR